MQYQSYLVTYDISDPKRWRKVYRAMRGFGDHLQLSVFLCDLTDPRRARLRTVIDALIHHEEDQVIIARLGPTGAATLRRVEVLGRKLLLEPPSPTIL